MKQGAEPGRGVGQGGLRAPHLVLGLTLLALATLLACRESAPPPNYVRLSGTAPQVPGPLVRAQLVVFWASWCAPCVEELPSLRALARDLPEGLALRTVSFREAQKARARYFGGEVPPELNFLEDPEGRLAEAFGVSAAPAAFLHVGGRQVARFTGPRDWDAAAMRSLLGKLVSEASGTLDENPSGQPKR